VYVSDSTRTTRPFGISLLVHNGRKVLPAIRDAWKEMQSETLVRREVVYTGCAASSKLGRVDKMWDIVGH
jgi:hypothetical protein